MLGFIFALPLTAVLCLAQWVPEVSVEDVSRMEPVCHIKAIQKERWELMCCLCKCARKHLSPFSSLLHMRVLGWSSRWR